MNEKFILVDGHKIRYLDSLFDNDATTHHLPTLVLIHGLGASAERWASVAPTLHKYFRLIIPDLIGFGLSDKPQLDYTPEFFAEFLDHFLKNLGIQTTHMIGSSLGGQIVAEYASQNNNSIDKLILVSSAGVMKSSTSALNAYIMAALYPNHESAKNAFEIMTGSPKNIDLQIVNSFVKRMQMPNAKMAFMSTLLGLKNSEPITTKLQSITAPTLVIWGGKDPVIPIEHADKFISSIPDCRFFKMDYCGHTPYVEDPARFCNIVLDFLGVHS